MRCWRWQDHRLHQHKQYNKTAIKCSYSPSEAVPDHHIMDYTPVSDELRREIIDLAISIAAQNRAKKAARRAARERAAEKRAGVAKRKAERLAKKELKMKVY